jgi:hypothetical protein
LVDVRLFEAMYLKVEKVAIKCKWPSRGDLR